MFCCFLCICLAGWMMTQVYSLKAQQGSRLRFTASVLASSTLERVQFELERDFSWNSRQARSPVAGTSLFEMAVGQTYAPDGQEDLKRVQCDIYWQDPGLGPQEYSLDCEFYRESR